MICLHTHWPLLGGCRVELPIRIGAAEREFWTRLVDNVAVQLHAYGSARRPGRGGQLVEAGPALAPVRLEPVGDRATVAFSGGKDSLVQTGLVAELTERPLLVSVTSPVPWARDHVGAARERARAEVAKRLRVDVVEVQSDFRTAWDLGFSARDGCSLGVHELSDLLLYHGVMAAVAAATGSAHSFMASEADIQYNRARDGEVILHPEFLSSAVTQSALDALLRGFGLGKSSLTYPLHMPYVQRLLVSRYGELADLQFSCWRAPEGSQACSACLKCFQIALVTLGEGLSPRAVGIDPIRVLCAFGDWPLDTERPAGWPILDDFRTARHHIVRILQQLPTDAAESVMLSEPRDRADAQLGEALAIFARLRAEALAWAIPAEPGYIGGFFDFMRPDLREPVRAIFDQHFPRAREAEFAPIVARAKALARWISEPLAMGQV
jgi:hypothetical protein